MTSQRNRFLRGPACLVVCAAWLCVPAGAAPALAQTAYQTLHSFSEDARQPIGIVRGDDGSLYGANMTGGPYGYGTVFKLTPDGMGGYAESTLLAFDGTNGGNPRGGLTRGPDGDLYGMTGLGYGTIFKITESGTYTPLYTFTYSGGYGLSPYSRLSLGSDGLLYGCTLYGGANGNGNVFSVTSTGVRTVLASFSSPTGQYCYGGVILASDGNVYGTAETGGTSNYGTIFRVSAGTIAVLYSFSGGADGAYPLAGLVQASDGNIYGTARQSGGSYYGSVFKLIPSTGAVSFPYVFTNYTMGAYPLGGLAQGSDGNLYGTAQNGGTSGGGVVFKLTLGGAYSAIHSFSCSATCDPVGDLTPAADGRIYGTTWSGSTNLGGVFAIDSGTVSVVHDTTYSDGGIYPYGNVVQLPGGDFIGTTYQGGTDSRGTIFRMDGAGAVTTLLSFDYANGAYPWGNLILASDGDVYGTTLNGGTYGRGTVFKVTPAGVHTLVHSFNGAEGSNPYSGVVEGPGGALYGTTYSGGAYGRGTVFSMTPAGAVTVLASFNGSTTGGYPLGGLAVGSDGTVYGTTIQGGTDNYGIVFSVTSSGVFSVLHSFTGTPDGGYPYGSLAAADDGYIYGTTYYGGANGRGTVFRISSAGAVSTFYSWSATYSDGYYPFSGVLQAGDGNLYGIAQNGGIYGRGGVYRLTLDGDYSLMYSFGTTDGYSSYGSLVESTSGLMYGTTYSGGTAQRGTVFTIKRGVLVTLSDLSQIYDGSPRAATVTTDPPDFPVVVTYTKGGVPVSAPTDVGYYQVTAAVDDPVYGGSATGTLVISRATPTITWANPANITYGTPLSSTQLNATANTPGTFYYTYGAGYVLPAGTRTLHVTFYPTDTTNYTSASADVTIEVEAAAPTITWNNPANIVYGAALSGSQLNAYANATGTFTYTPAVGTVLDAGNGQTLHVEFTSTSPNYGNGSKDVTINVLKATPSIIWANPASIPYGTALGAAQLNATASVAGTFTYTPDAGMVLNAGSQTLHVDFQPTDASNYNTASRNVTLNVIKATPTVTATGASATYDGSPHPAACSVTGVGGEDLGPLNATYSPGGSAPPSAAGSYTATCSFGGSTNYNSASATATVTIGKASSTVAVDDLTVAYDRSPHPTTATVSGVGTGITQTVSWTYSGACGSAPVNVADTPCTATATYAGDANHSGSSGDGRITIVARTASVTPNAASKTYGAADPALGGTLTGFVEGDGVTATYARVAGETVVGGPYTISATLAPAGILGNYDVTYNTADFTIDPAAATLTLTNLSQAFDGTARTVGVSSTPGSLSGITVTYDGGSTPPTDAGSYAIIASLNDSNYTASPARGTLVVARATPIVTVTGGPFTYNGSAHAATCSAVGVQSENLGGATLGYSPGGATAPVNAGSYTATCSLAQSTNYEAASASETLVINTVPLTVTADNQTKTYDGAVFGPFTVAYAGFVGGEGPASLGGALTFGGSAAGAINAGSYVITPGGLSSSNYAITFASGTLTINKGPQVIIVTGHAPASAAFGSSFTVAATGGGSSAPLAFGSTGGGCTNSGALFTMTSGVTACVVHYTQAGDSNYLPAPEVTETVNAIGFAFEGFFAPVEMTISGPTVWNAANAGQAIPIKWRLTLGGSEVASAASFVGLYSYPVSCSSGTGDVENGIDEYAPGESGLIYLGDGRFQYNWKTPKNYKGSCRALFVQFGDGSVSPVATFKFK